MMWVGWAGTILAGEPHAEDQSVTIMPLGDSITQGGRTFGCYRHPLRERLAAGGYHVRFVGSQAEPAPLGMRHEGHGGKTAEYLAANIERLYRANPADIVLLHAGHNHFVEEKPVEGIVAAHEKIIQTIGSIRPDATIFMAQVIPSGKLPKYAYIEELNEKLARLAKRMEGGRPKVILVNHAEGFDWRTDTIDDKVHPNARGAAKMAGTWYEAMREAWPAK